MAEYLIEKHEHGWLLCATEGRKGVPLTALAECQALCGKDAVHVLGIPHHYNYMGHTNHVVLAVTTKAGAAKWEQDIADALKDYEPQERWWRGTDVGQSSAAMFHVLCTVPLEYASGQMGQKSVPRDADDFGRCQRLIAAIPEWRTRLGEVAAKHPDTPWPAIIARWGELEAAMPGRVREILHECGA